MKPALAQISTLHASMETDVADYAAGKCPAIELWLGKLDTYLQTHSLEELTELLARHAMRVPVASFQGGLLVSQGDARREHWDFFERRLRQCQALGVETLVLALDIFQPLAPQDLQRVAASLAQAAEQAARHRVRLALEPQAKATFGNNLQTAIALVEQTANPNLGICFDAFHYYTGPSKQEDLQLLTRANLFHVQLCDLAGTVREIAADADRILPGEGDFQLAHLLDHLRAIDYDAYVSIELMNPQIWKVPPLQFGEIGMTALRRLLDQAGR